MKLEPTDWSIEDFSGEPLDNVLILISDGKVKKAQLPEFAEIKIITHENKIKQIKCEQRVPFN